MVKFNVSNVHQNDKNNNIANVLKEIYKLKIKNLNVYQSFSLETEVLKNYENFIRKQLKYKMSKCF